MDYRHRRFGRNAPHISPDIFVEHDVADDKEMLVAPFMLDLVNYIVKLFNH